MKSTTLRNRKTLYSCLSWIALLCISVYGFVGLHWLRNPDRIAIFGLSGLISVGFLGMWRWSWTGLQLLRGRIYLHWVFPRWRRRADQVPVAELPPVCFLVPTYKEQPWITERVFQIIAQEAQTLTQPMTLLVTSSSEQENAAIRAVLESVDPELSCIRLIQMVQTGEGKRKAMADGLRELARLNLPSDTIVALMDGDSELTPGTLRRCLPFFRLFPKMGALTTDELPVVHGSYLFSEWFHLRMAQRHYQMSSVSLSQKVTCLTGRFSLFVSEAAFAPTFADQLEMDTLDDWLWGKFKFLSGDDKSTWYWLLRHGYDMIYVPDVIVYSIETISGSLINRAYQNMRRWYGNMLRNSNRAIALGPQKTGLFIWFCLLDQKLNMWTSLTTPGLLLIYLFQAKWMIAGLIFSWILASRPLYLSIIFLGRQSKLKPIHFPLLLISMWSASVVKIWTQMNLAQQKWSNRGNQSISAEGSGLVRLAKVGTSRSLYYAQLFSFVIILLWLANLLNPLQDIGGMLWNSRAVAKTAPTQIVEAINYNIIPNDGKDDAASLQTLINNLPTNNRVQINLPIGEIDLFHPVEINRSHTLIKGQGTGRTILQSHFHPQVGEAVLTIRPKKQAILQQSSTSQTNVNSLENRVQDVQLKNFTLRQVLPASTESASAVNSIILEQVVKASLQHLDIEKSRGYALVLRQTQDVKVEYVL